MTPIIRNPSNRDYSWFLFRQNNDTEWELMTIDCLYIAGSCSQITVSLCLFYGSMSTPSVFYANLACSSHMYSLKL